MAVIIKAPAKINDEWKLIELQGDLKSHSDTPYEGKLVGDLHYAKNGIPVLIIGHHLMYGKEVMLEKPYALLEKAVNGDVNDADNKITEYSVKSVITKKILFKTRPKPIVFSNNSK